MAEFKTQTDINQAFNDNKYRDLVDTLRHLNSVEAVQRVAGDAKSAEGRRALNDRLAELRNG